jgi:hypothetical protein
MPSIFSYLSYHYYKRSSSISYSWSYWHIPSSCFNNYSCTTCSSNWWCFNRRIDSLRCS